MTEQNEACRSYKKMEPDYGGQDILKTGISVGSKLWRIFSVLAMVAVLGILFARLFSATSNNSATLAAIVAIVFLWVVPYVVRSRKQLHHEP